MRFSIVGLAALALAVMPGCSPPGADRTDRPKTEILSIRTDLDPAVCRKEIDRSDPNETPYLVCPGVAGYTLIVRRVDAGRESIDVVDSNHRVLPLNYHEFVTRRMATLDGRAEWRVATRDGKQTPIALIVRLQAREDNGDPEKVTRSYYAVAKITPGAACVTDSIAADVRSEADVRSAADSAEERACAPPQPPLTVDGAVVR